MHEMNHRMKNTLAVVQAITSQSFRSASSLEEASASVAQCIAAYAKARDILLQRNWSGTTIGAIVEATADTLALAHSDRFRMSGPALEVGPQAALSFALVLHELATSARKYGALSIDEGTVDIVWSISPMKARWKFRLSWAENGGPHVVPPQRKGFGSRLLNSSLRSFGSAGVEFLPVGIRLSFEGDLQTIQNKNYSDAER